MKRISIVGLLIVLSACSTHTVKCHGPLRPINKAGSTAQKSDASSDAVRREPQP